LRAVARALPGQDGKAVAPVELESWPSEVATWIAVFRSGLSVTASIGVQSRVAPLHRRGLDWRARWRGRLAVFWRPHRLADYVADGSIQPEVCTIPLITSGRKSGTAMPRRLALHSVT
jgi:hypothetical protein